MTASPVAASDYKLDELIEVMNDYANCDHKTSRYWQTQLQFYGINAILELQKYRKKYGSL